MDMLVVEHLERLSEWVWLEYSHLARFWEGELLFTNVRSPEERRKLERLGKVEQRSVVELPGEKVVLDPRGKDPLRTEDTVGKMLVIGGICGDFELHHRTEKFISSRMEAEVRNLGPRQLTTDTAAIAVKLIAGGKRLEDLEFTDSLEIELDRRMRVELPYGYLLVDGKPLITPGLVELLEREGNP